jgi:hypothetical protein
MRRASGRYNATKRFSAVLNAEVEEMLRLRLSDMNVKGKFAYICGQQSGVKLLAISGFNCRSYISSLTIFSKYSALYLCIQYQTLPILQR